MKNLVIFGAGGHSKSCIEIILQDKRYKINKIIGLPGTSESKILNFKVDNTDHDLEKLRLKNKNAFIGIGQIKTPAPRVKIYNTLIKNNFLLPSFLSKNSYVSKNSEINDSCIIMNKVNINSGVTIHSNCIVNTGAIIEHDVNVEKHCHISTGAILNGGVIIGEGSFIGSGSIIHELVKIKKNSIIPAGSIVKK
tara:strand:+ start:846 stop:1427 length:582 start_codon:yes stop_codon:yes gene_type:complete